MGTRLVKRRLAKVGSRLKALRAELPIVDEQLLYLGDDADDSEIRAIVDTTGGSNAEARGARGTHDGMVKHRAKIVAEIAELERRQDELLDQLNVT